MSKRALKAVDLDLDAPGKDISHLFASSLSTAPDARQSQSIHLERLLDNPYQPRTQMNAESLDELARVIESQGFQGVLVARPHPERRGYYQLTAGHRRREAAKRAGLAALPVVSRDLSDEEMVTLAVTENIQREDLTPLEEGRIYLLMNREMGYKLEQIAREIGKTIGYVYNRVRVAKAPLDVQALVETKPDSLRAVANLIKVQSKEERAEIIQALLGGVITTDDIPLYIRNLRATKSTAGEDSEVVAEKLVFDTEPHQAQLPGIEVAPASAAPTNAEPPLSFQPETVLINGVETPIERELGSMDVADFYRRTNSAYARSLERAEDRARSSRARRSKLSRILVTLQAFSDGVESSNDLSREEKLDLAIISLFVDRLCERLGIDKNNV